MPESFAFPNDVTQMWVPITFKEKQLTCQNVFLRMYARLAPGVLSIKRRHAWRN